MDIRRWVFIVAIVVTGALGGCATGYQKLGLGGGFSERRISDTAYYVAFAGNGYASRERVHWFWMYRCAELTLEKNHSLFVISPVKRTSRSAFPEARFLPAAYGDGGGGRFVRTGHGGGSVIYLPGAPVTVTTWTSSANILMYDRPLPQEMADAWDAEAVRDALAPYVKSGGNAPLPVAKDVYASALVMHDEVGVQSIESVATPKSGDAASDARLPRTEASVKNVLDGPWVRAVLRIGYRAAFGPGSSQRVPSTAAWNITISPNGPVSQCDPVSSSLAKPELVEAITKFLKQLNFGPQDVSETQVTRVTFYFKPLD